MTDSEIAGLDRQRDELLADDAELRQRRNRTSQEWVREARKFEAELDEYPGERVDIWCDAGNAWVYAGELDEAERCYRQAAAEEHEPGMPDPRVFYATFLLDHGGDEARGHELLSEVWKARGTEPLTYHYVAETLEHQELFEQALTWANTGLSRGYPQPFDPDADEVMANADLDMLLSARLRVRQALEQPADTLDELSREVRAMYQKALRAPERRDPAPVRTGAVVLYWPEAEFHEVVRRWPDSVLAAEAGSHVEHRREVERSLRRAAEGHTPSVVQGKIAGFEEFCRESALNGSSRSSRDEYAAQLQELGHGISWPPGRNDRCWCGSQRKYKKCCGAPGFADIPAESGVDQQ